ncbi:MAG: choice-of-anchor I family protein [Flavobacteriales bacterium]|nr:choice-of-anchor I family protein [Flavobacteriales bacterium]
MKKHNLFLLLALFNLLIISCSDDDASTSSANEETTEMSTDFSLVGSLYLGGEGYSEISAYDSSTKKLYSTSAEDNSIHVIDLSNPANPTKIKSIDLNSYGGVVNSVSVSNGVLAVAVEAKIKQDNGSIVTFNTSDDSYLNSYTVGALPDMVTFSPNGKLIISANEGEPNDAYDNDPKGSISIINVETGVINTLYFDSFNSQQTALEANGFRVFGPGADLAKDVEPEYIAISDDSKMAYVTLQENNGIAEVNLETLAIVRIIPLGTKDYTNELVDFSDKDDKISFGIPATTVKGFYMPDAIAYANGYLITANEGDSRDYKGYSEEVRIEDLILDATKFPNADFLQQKEILGRLKTTTANGDTDGDGDVDQLYCYGGRSFSIWDTSGNLVYDSGSILGMEATKLGIYDDGRSDDKGVEPESVEVIKSGGKTYLFVGTERTTESMVLLFDITNPMSPVLKSTLRSPNHVAPEGLLVIPASESPNGKDLVVVTHEVDGNIAVYSN